MVGDALLPQSAAVKTYMNPTVIDRVVAEHGQGRINREHEIWALLIFEYWHRTFIEGRGWRPAELEPSLPHAEAV
jgi:hypothetical protein